MTSHPAGESRNREAPAVSTSESEAAMTVQTIRVPLPLPRRSPDDTEVPVAQGTGAADGPCSHAGRCDRDACGQAERVKLNCPSLDTPPTSLL